MLLIYLKKFVLQSILQFKTAYAIIAVGTILVVGEHTILCFRDSLVCIVGQDIVYIRRAIIIIENIGTFVGDGHIELSCDERVIRLFGEKSKSTYSHMLIRMEAKKSGHEHSPNLYFWAIKSQGAECHKSAVWIFCLTGVYI